MVAELIDGKAAAAQWRGQMKNAVAELRNQYALQPGLAVVIVGEHAPSQIYVRNKHKATLEIGMHSVVENYSDKISQSELLAVIDRLNNDPAIHGILVQLPLPPQIDVNAVINAISPAKDVDGFHVLNAGRLAVGMPAMIPCTPKGSLRLLKAIRPDLSGLAALIIGRSNIVGKPMAQLLLAESCTVTIAHSRTVNLPELCGAADIVVAAIGKPEIVKGAWLKPGALVIDVGINRVEDAREHAGYRLVGDVEFKTAAERASHITPVPGGVGPMTIAALLSNTIKAACLQKNIERPDV